MTVSGAHRALALFQASVGKHFKNKIWRKVPKFFLFAHSGFQFAHHEFNSSSSSIFISASKQNMQ